MELYSIIIERENEKDQRALKIKTKDGLKTKLELEEIDSLTSTFRDEDAFLTDIAKNGALPYIPEKCFIGYYNNGELKKINIIYNSPIIHKIATDVIHKINKGFKKEQIFLEPNNDIKDLIRKIKDLAVNDGSELRFMYTSKIFSKYEYDILVIYRQLKINFNTDLQNCIINEENLKLLEELSKKIDKMILKYNLYRKIYLWNRKYKNKQEKNETKESDYNQMELSDFMVINNKQESTMEDKGFKL